MCDVDHILAANNYARACIAIRPPISRKGARSRRVADFLSACKSVSYAGKVLSVRRMASEGLTPISGLGHRLGRVRPLARKAAGESGC